MYKELLDNGIKAGLHWGSERNKVNPDTYGYVLGYRSAKLGLKNTTEKKVYSVIDLDLSFQALRRAILYVNKARLEGGQIVCVIDNSLPATLSQQLRYFALNNNLLIKTGKEAQAMLKLQARLKLSVKGKSALPALSKSVNVAGLFTIGGLNSGRAMTIVAARKACVPVISLCEPSACLDGITYPVVINTTSSSALYYILEVVTYALHASLKSSVR
jgi:ribosomal protein S2